MYKILTAAPLSILLFASAAQAAQPSEPTQCDLLAGAIGDQQNFSGIAGVWFYELQNTADAAIAACTDAYSQYGNVGRYAYLLARSYMAAGKEVEQIVPLAQEAVGKGHTNAHMLIANVYRFGYGQTIDLAKYFEWSKKGADLGNAMALTHLGIAYQRGLGVEAAPALAREFYAKGIKAGDALAPGALGMMISEGIGASKDPAQAIPLVQQSVKLRSRQAIGQLGNMTFLGQGMEADQVKGAALWKQAADMGWAISARNFGIVLSEGLGGQTQDYGQAEKYFKRAAALGDPVGNAKVAELYIFGRIGATAEGKPDYPTALEWLKKGQAEGEPIATGYLGQFYEKGLGVAQNWDTALAYYKQAGNVSAVEAAMERRKAAGQ